MHIPGSKEPFIDDSHKPLDGIAFRSSKRNGGINYTWFIDQDGCCDDESESGAVMVLKNIQRTPP